MFVLLTSTSQRQQVRRKMALFLLLSLDFSNLYKGAENQPDQDFFQKMV